MKVILLADIPKVGKKYEVKDFKEGYAQNVLLSRGLAELATPQALSKLARQKELLSQKVANEKASFEALLMSLKDKDFIIKANANEKGHLFKSINAHDIVSVIKQSSGIEVNEDTLKVANIKALGTHEFIIKKGDREEKFSVSIQPSK